MASTPIFVHSKRLRTNLPDLFVSHPFDIARIREQEEIDEQEWIRRVNLNENDYCVPNPEYKVVDGKKVIVPLSRRTAKLKCKLLVWSLIVIYRYLTITLLCTTWNCIA